MKIELINPKSVKTLVSLDQLCISKELQASVTNDGLIMPVIISDGVLCDGHKRLLLFIESGKELIPSITSTHKPGVVYATLNRNRIITPIEVAMVSKKLTDTELGEFLALASISDSPHMRVALKFIADHLVQLDQTHLSSMPVATWRELAHLEDHMIDFAIDLAILEATVSEKRLIAQLLRQCLRKKSLPDSIVGKKAAEIIADLKKIAQPRKTQALEKFNQALKNAELPPGASIKIDSNFDKPGIELAIRVNRSNTERLSKAHEAIEKIFSQVDEL